MSLLPRDTVMACPCLRSDCDWPRSNFSPVPSKVMVVSPDHPASFDSNFSVFAGGGSRRSCCDIGTRIGRVVDRGALAWAQPGPRRPSARFTCVVERHGNLVLVVFFTVRLTP